MVGAGGMRYNIGMKMHVLALFCAVAAACSAAGEATTAFPGLRTAFEAAPETMPLGCYYYWINERVDEEGVRKDLEWMKEVGITRFFLGADIRTRFRKENPWEGQTFGDNKFMSEKWWGCLRTALKTAGELGLEAGLFNSPGWSVSGGPWIREEEAMRSYVVDAGNTGHGTQDRGDKRCWEVCNSPHFPGKVTNDPASPEGTGYEVDKLSAKHVKKHFDSYIGEILRRIPAEERKTLTTIVIDSWEAGTQNYTDDIFDRFKARFGYDLDYANPAHVSDLKTLVGELVVSEFMGTMVKCAHENGLKVWTEPHAWGTFPADPTAYVSMADEAGTEFWDKGPLAKDKKWFGVVEKSIAAIRKSGKNIVYAESFTRGGWGEKDWAKDDWSFAHLKPIAIKAFRRGVNANILHLVVSQPGDDTKEPVRPWFGNFFDRRSQNAVEVPRLVRYLKRCNFLLQQGKPLGERTDARILDDGTTIELMEDGLFRVSRGDVVETWNPEVSKPRPLIPGDYSDPDVIRVGTNYYMVTSSFQMSPGVPVLRSCDLKNWVTVSHAVPDLTKFSSKYGPEKMQMYGKGIYAPSIRKHRGKFYVYVPSVDEGIIVSVADNPEGPWKADWLKKADGTPWKEGRWSDPCPFWEDAGNGERVTGNGWIAMSALHRNWTGWLFKLSDDGMQLLDDGWCFSPYRSTEGHKLYKRGDWYYLFHIEFLKDGHGEGSYFLRSKDINGPYELKYVPLSIPGQGALVDDTEGRTWWIAQFNTPKEPIGRAPYICPVEWKDGWPEIGGPTDAFAGGSCAQAWQCNHVAEEGAWDFASRPGWLRIEGRKGKDFFHTPNVACKRVIQYGDETVVSCDIDTSHLKDGEEAGLALFNGGVDYAICKGVCAGDVMHCEWRISGELCRSNDGQELTMRGAKYRGINWGLYTTGAADFRVVTW